MEYSEFYRECVKVTGKVFASEMKRTIGGIVEKGLSIEDLTAQDASLVCQSYLLAHIRGISLFAGSLDSDAIDQDVRSLTGKNMKDLSDKEQKILDVAYLNGFKSGANISRWSMLN